MHELANRRNTLLLLIEDGDEQKKVELAEVDAKIQQLIEQSSLYKDQKGVRDELKKERDEERKKRPF